MGISDASYCRMVNFEDLPKVPEEEFIDYLLWLFRKGSDSLYYIGRRARAGLKNRNNIRRNI